jgi:hypothetical protein
LNQAAHLLSSPSMRARSAYTQWAILVLIMIVTTLPLIAASGAYAADDEAPIAAPTASAEAMAPAALDELLAPIALYPDTLLAQVFAASAYPQEVMDGGNWLPDNENLKGAALQEAAKKAGFGPSMQALVLFPTVVDMMCQNFDWTKQLGSAFNTDQGAVFASVQRLRAQAAAVGNLKSTPEQKVETQTINSQKVIIIQPADPKIIYVPAFDPQVVYVQQPPPQPGPNSSDVAAAAVFGFAAGVIVGSIFSNHSYYPYPNWGYGGIYYGGHPYRYNVYVYRPNYHYGYRPGYRPGSGYRPPPNYHNGWNRPSTLPAYRGSGNNYFNRFDGNQNQRPGSARPPLVRPDISNRPGGYNPPARPGNGTGTGTRPPVNGNGAGSGTRAPGSGAARPSTRPATPSGGAGTPSTRPATPAWKGQQEYRNAKPNADRGFGSTPNRPQQSNPPQYGQSGRASAGRPQQPATQRPETQTRPSNGSGGTGRNPDSSGMGGGFTQRGQTSGSQDRAAANRGRASVGSGGARPIQNSQQGKRPR